MIFQFCESSASSVPAFFVGHERQVTLPGAERVARWRDFVFMKTVDSTKLTSEKSRVSVGRYLVPPRTIRCSGLLTFSANRLSFSKCHSVRAAQPAPVANSNATCVTSGLALTYSVHRSQSLSVLAFKCSAAG